MYAMFGQLAARADGVARRVRAADGQATVEYVGLLVILGAGLGLVATALDGLGFATKIGTSVIKGITSALGKVIP